MCECQWWWCTFIYWFWSDRSNSQARVSAQHQPIKYSESNITLFPLLEHWNHLENGDKLNDGLYFRFSSSRQETSIVFFFYWNGGRVHAMLEKLPGGSYKVQKQSWPNALRGITNDFYPVKPKVLLHFEN